MLQYPSIRRALTLKENCSYCWKATAGFLLITLIGAVWIASNLQVYQNEQLLDDMLNSPLDASIDHSEIIVDSPAMRSIVGKGQTMLDPVYRRMRTPGISFDSFARLYSAANQIVQAQGGRPIFWTGGAGVIGNTLVPLGQEPESIKEFELAVLADVKSRIQRP